MMLFTGIRIDTKQCVHKVMQEMNLIRAAGALGFDGPNGLTSHLLCLSIPVLVVSMIHGDSTRRNINTSKYYQQRENEENQA